MARDVDKHAMFDDGIGGTLNASKMLSWAYGVESHPEDYSKDDCAKASAIMFYYDHWRALVNAVKTVTKLSED